MSQCEWIMVKVDDYLKVANALGVTDNVLVTAAQRLTTQPATGNGDKELLAVATSLCTYWDSLSDGEVVDGLVHAMNRLGRVLGDQRLKDRVRSHVMAAHKMKRSQTS